jgi:hypothetical protein
MVKFDLPGGRRENPETQGFGVAKPPPPCLGITGAMRTAPTAAMEALLGLPPLHLQVEVETRVGNYRLHCNDQWKPKSEGFGHAHMFQDIEKETILQMGV